MDGREARRTNTGRDKPLLRSRRDLLRQISMVGLGLAGAPRLGWPSLWPSQDEEIVPFTDVPADFSVERLGEVYRLDLRELRSWITPTAEFFTVRHYDRPQIDAGQWRLEIAGMVTRPRRLSLEDIRRLPRIERTVTFECSGNRIQRHHGMVGNATWTGTPLRPLLEEAAPADEAIEVAFWGADKGTETIRAEEFEQNFARAMSLEEAMSEGALLVYEMNGEPLAPQHGYPLRLIVPGWYGIAQVKWLERIEVNDRRLMNRFMGRDYVTIMGREQNGRIQWFERSVARQRVKSVIARVTKTPASRLRIFGVAWTDGTPLRSVEIRIDEGTWQPADLEHRGNPFAWTFFTLEADPLPSGEHHIVSRATDAKGRAQPENLELKKTYWEDNAQFTRTVLVS